MNPEPIQAEMHGNVHSADTNTFLHIGRLRGRNRRRWQLKNRKQRDGLPCAGADAPGIFRALR